ncbi:MAG: hypothetical protein IID46_04180 [Planctomycetes bacterium]|nr:hypothetical protein [Planctomycetota bacterium]
MTDLAKYAFVLTLSLAFAGCGDDKKTGETNNKKGSSRVTIDQSSPEKVAESFRQACKAKDWKSVFACVTKESYDTLVFGTMKTAGFSTSGDEDKTNSLNELFEKHGIDDQIKKLAGNPVTVVKDKMALFDDLMDWLEKNAPASKKNMILQLASVRFSNFKTEGDKAIADFSMNGQKSGKPAEFKKLDGQWFLDMVVRSGGTRTAPPRFPR